MNKKSEQKQHRKDLARRAMETRADGGQIAGKDFSPAAWFTRHISRRTVGKGLAWTAGLTMAGVSIYQFSGDDDPEVALDSLELQRKEGWNIGSTDKQLAFADGSSTTDSLQQQWTAYDPNYLTSIWQPRSAEWQPFFVPTLLQSLAQPSLNAQMRPIVTAQMRDGYERAQGLRELLGQAQNAKETMIIADLPGPTAVAVGAALADTANLVPQFDNWPHPLGVVRAHETAGAMVYYAREVEQKKALLKENAPAVVLLDNQRLAPYGDADNQFDNRYLAKLPPTDQLKQLGVSKVIYLVKDQSHAQELDDLNDDLAEWQKNGINVQMLRLSDFKPVDEEVTRKDATGTTTRVVERHHYYGGSPFAHWWFYSHYSYNPYPSAGYARGDRYVPYSRPTTAPNVAPPAYRPVTRPTIFNATRVGGPSSGGVGKTKPSGFGRTSVRMSDGRVTGTRAGRSGSYGRGFGSWFGG